MDEIRPWLYIGSYEDTLDVAVLRAYSIGAILQLAENVKHADIQSLYLPIIDFSPIPHDLIRGGVAFVREQKQQGRSVLVACRMGINRSSAFCTAALKEEEGLGLLTAFREVKRHHREADPYRPVWESLCQYYREDVPFRELGSHW
jgi:protein-tyrosine phosphatase